MTTSAFLADFLSSFSGDFYLISLSTSFFLIEARSVFLVDAYLFYPSTYSSFFSVNCYLTADCPLPLEGDIAFLGVDFTLSFEALFFSFDFEPLPADDALYATLLFLVVD